MQYLPRQFLAAKVSGVLRPIDTDLSIKDDRRGLPMIEAIFVVVCDTCLFRHCFHKFGHNLRFDLSETSVSFLLTSRAANAYHIYTCFP